MVIEEQISAIRERFRQGQRRNEIKEDLIEQGYEEQDIDDTIAKIQHDVIKELPGISCIYRHVEHFESKPNAGSPKTTFLLMIVCITFLLILAAGLYISLDPLGTHASGRDVKRQSDATIIENGLTQYFQKYQQYPDTLDEMAPDTLSNIPRDPQSGAEYSYQPLDANTNFKLCINFEEQQQQCVNATPAISGIPVVPTDTPEPTFSPQSANVSPTESKYHAN
jgi:hypothetical protein